MPLGEKYIPLFPAKLTAEERELNNRISIIPGARLDFTAHPTDFKWDEADHPRDEIGRFGEGGGGNKPGGEGFGISKDGKKPPKLTASKRPKLTIDQTTTALAKLGYSIVANSTRHGTETSYLIERTDTGKRKRMTAHEIIDWIVFAGVRV
jgi:hypothetical protein